MRRPILAGNWKMNKTPVEAVDFVKELAPHLASFSYVESVVCPPLVALPGVVAALTGSNIGVGAQNMHWADSGRVYGRGFRADAEGLGGLRHHRPLRAPAVLW